MKKIEDGARIAIYPGSFDPLTLGHLDIIERAQKIFDRIVVAVATNTSKKNTFSPQERVEMIRGEIGEQSGITVENFHGLLIDYASSKGAKTIIRGMRTVSDFEYELQMATANKSLDQSTETVFMVTDSKYSHISSSLIKEIVSLGGSAERLIPNAVEEQLRIKLCSKKNFPEV